MHLTEKAVAKIVAGKKREQYPDDKQPGFGLRVSPDGKKSFHYYAKVGGQVVFRAIGNFPAMSVDDARAKAEEWAGLAASWKLGGYKAEENPFKKERAEPAEPATVPTFQQLLDAYVERHVKETANHPGKAEYMARWTAKKYFSAWTAKPIDTITVDDVLSVKNACGKKKFAANRAVEFIRALYNWSAGRTDGKVHFWRVENPAKDVSFYEENSRDRYLQPGELSAFNKALEQETHVDLKDFLVLAMNTGARKSDILSMRWHDVQWERLTWVVPYPKNGESYDVSLLPAAVAVLKRRRREIPDSAEHVFPGVGESKHLIDLKKPWEAFRVRAGIADIRVHDLRRTVGSYLAIKGASLQTIGAALGHKSLQSTEVYARLHASAVREALESSQQKMLEMMAAAKRREKAAAKRPAKMAARRPKLLKSA